MTNQERKELRNMLVAKHDALKRELKQKTEAVISSGTELEAKRFVGDSADDADQNISDFIDAEIYQMKHRELKRIEEAIKRLDDGKYGVCLDCEETISFRRLEALPFATRCKDCEERREVSENGLRKRPQGISSFSFLDN